MAARSRTAKVAIIVGVVIAYVATADGARRLVPVLHSALPADTPEIVRSAIGPSVTVLGAALFLACVLGAVRIGASRRGRRPPRTAPGSPGAVPARPSAGPEPSDARPPDPGSR